ncbi:MYG1 protein C694.04c-like [Zingiber officinale]|uniref:MYG1 protein C694.04c-like n=1 Tax=Zingiber officinale TaxID=94328 RepID=UPI001C4AC90D|nr:MYG1 protein C694.04c-like [Zingiber officinale]
MLPIRRWWRPIASRSFAYFSRSPIAGTVAYYSTASHGTGTKRVGTHNGCFHCDEALACFMIRLTAKFSGAEIVRTRDIQLLDTLDAVLDVGGEYDPSRDRYDHHQKGFNEVFGRGFVTKLSSAGLIYKHYGEEIIAKELQLDKGHKNVQCLYLAVYKNFIEAIDATDNGINQYDIDQPPKYVNNTYLSSRIGRLNPEWIDLDQSSEKENAAFHQAMMLAGGEFLASISFYARSWLPARSIVIESLEARSNVDPSSQILLLKKFCPWNLHLLDLEKELKINPLIMFVIYQDERTKIWRVQAAPVSPEKFDCRKRLPEPWRGFEGDELSEITGIPGCVFVHMAGFMGKNRTYEGALAMARTALRSSSSYCTF